MSHIYRKQLGLLYICNFFFHKSHVEGKFHAKLSNVPTSKHIQHTQLGKKKKANLSSCEVNSKSQWSHLECLYLSSTLVKWKCY